MIERGLLQLDEADERAAMDAHAHMLDFKKRGAFLRLWRRRRHGKPVPRYRYKLTGPLPLRRVAFESLLGLIFKVCSFKISRWLVAQMPVGLTGRLFERARRLWKNLTRSTKRKGFYALTFAVENPSEAEHGAGPHTHVLEDQA